MSQAADGEDGMNISPSSHSAYIHYTGSEDQNTNAHIKCMRKIIEYMRTPMTHHKPYLKHHSTIMMNI